MTYRLQDNYVSVSDFSQGKANKIFNKVQAEGKDYIVMKNNKPSAVIMPVEKYNALVNQIKRVAKYRSLLSANENEAINSLDGVDDHKVSIGLAKDVFVASDDFDWCNDEICELFEV